MDECIQFYLYDDGITYDEGGFIVPCVYHYVTINEWRYFRDSKDVAYLLCRNLQAPGTYVELIKVENEYV